MKRVPVLLAHDTSGTPIGSLELNVSRLPDGMFAFDPAFSVLEKVGNVITKADLLEVSVIQIAARPVAKDDADGWITPAHLPPVSVGGCREFNVCYFSNGKNRVTTATYFNDYVSGDDWEMELPEIGPNHRVYQKQEGGEVYITGWFFEDVDEEHVQGFTYELRGWKPLPEPMP